MSPTEHPSRSRAAGLVLFASMLPVLSGTGCGDAHGRTEDKAMEDGHETSEPIITASDAAEGHEDAGVVPRDDGTCDVPAHCPPPTNPCLSAVCVLNECQIAPANAGTALLEQVSGDCAELRCDKASTVMAVLDLEDVPADDGDPCTTASCAGAQPHHLTVPAGTLAADQTDGDCKRVECDAMGAVVTVADESDRPTTDACSMGTCEGPNPGSILLAQGQACGNGHVCDGAGECTACAAEAAPCDGDWECCGGTCHEHQCQDVPAPDDGGVQPDPTCTDGADACCDPSVKLGTVNGDAPGDPIVYHGQGAGLFSVTVQEVDHTFLTLTELRLRVELTSTVPHRFAVYDPASACNETVVSDLGLAVKETIFWSDTFQVEDTRALIIDVRPPATPADWTLTLTGNAP